MKKLIAGAAVAIGCLAAPMPGQAAPVLNPANGHYYDLILQGVSWDQAYAAADASTFLGLDGYLVTITSAQEQTFLNGLTAPAGFPLYWIAASDEAVEGEWRWVAGPESGQLFWKSGVGTVTYSNWDGGEPNDFPPTEEIAVANWAANGAWNDWFDNPNTLAAYVVEYSAPIPEPASLLLFGTGAAAIVRRVRQRRSAS